VAIADMFLKLQGVTGEAGDADHKGEIEVVSWSWGMHTPTAVATGQASGRMTMGELQVVKRVDQATATLMTFLRNNKLVETGKLTVRKAGKTPLEYFTIELEKVRITSIKTETENTEIVERVNLGFNKVVVSYTPQGATGAKGGGSNVFEAEAFPSS
jgi:type VI secretion system secreted protein Hcp